MPKIAKQLSAVEIKRKSAVDGLHAIGGVAGLQLQVRGEARSWVLRTMVGGRRRDIGLGSYPQVSIAEAREKAAAARAKVEKGVDPVQERRAARMGLAGALTFAEAARRLLASKAEEWKNAKHRAQWANTLEAYAYPRIGKMPVDQVQLIHVTEVLEPIWRTKTETASRLRARIEAVLGWATAHGLRSGLNPAAWKHNLDQVMPKPGKVRKVQHHAALPLDDMPAFMAALRSQAGTGARALELAILTATRSQEVRGLVWSELDLKCGTWTIPGERMKAGREHRVPLSPAALKLISSQPRIAGTDLVFPSARNKMLSDMTLSAVMRRMKVPAVPHGFRSTFRDWASERTNYPRDVAEMALAHTIGDKVEAAYRRGDLFDKRTKMMADWARSIAAPAAAGNVTPIRRRAGK